MHLVGGRRKKLFLDAMVVQQGRLTEKHKAASKDELLEMIRFGADTVIRMNDVEDEDFNIEDVLAQVRQPSPINLSRSSAQRSPFTITRHPLRRRAHSSRFTRVRVHSTKKTSEMTEKLKSAAGSSMAANFSMDGGAGLDLYQKEEEGASTGDGEAEER
eukprot:1884346-Rhodomonas_salina.1